MVFLPGEVVVDYALRLKRELDRNRLWVNAYWISLTRWQEICRSQMKSGWLRFEWWGEIAHPTGIWNFCVNCFRKVETSSYEKR